MQVNEGEKNEPGDESSDDEEAENSDKKNSCIHSN
jgi:hypothetical protein